MNSSARTCLVRSVAYLSIAALALSACSSSGTTSDATAGGSGGDAGATSLRIVLAAPPNSLDPCDSNQAANGPILLNNVTESLTFLDTSTGELRSSLAESWEAVDEQTWRFSLQEGVKFHDGQPFDAEAVVDWMTRILDPATGCYLLGGVLNENVLGAEVVDEHTVDILLQNPDPVLPRSLAFVSIGAPSDSPQEKIEEPVGTGPYEFVSYSPGQELKVTRSAEYRGEEPEVTDVTYVFREESSVRAAMAAAGEVDIAASIGNQDAAMDGAKNYTVAETLYFRIDATIPPTDDLRVRRAMNLAIDRQTFVENVLGGYGEPAYELFLPTTVGYNEAVVVEYDPDEARRLLAEAAADGVDLSVPIAVHGEANLRGMNGSESLETISTMLNEVGLNTSVQVVENSASIERRTNPISPDYDPVLLQNVHGNSLGDAHTTWSGKQACSATQTSICVEEFDALLQAAGEASDSERADLLQEVAAYHAENIRSRIPVAHMTDTIVIANEALVYEPNPATSEQLVISEIRVG